MFKNNNIEIVCDIDKNIVLNSYLNELQQVILNILKNAKDALVENNINIPYIKIEAKVDEQNIYLSITDNAGGIKTEPINKIFEAYFTTKPQSQGTGIGLYMSKMILEKSMKGKLFVENIEDKPFKTAMWIITKANELWIQKQKEISKQLIEEFENIK